MEATTARSIAFEFVISPEHVEAARRYIAAIVGRDPVSRLGNAFVESRSQELLERFASDYTALSHGPYARRGTDALHIALGRL